MGDGIFPPLPPPARDAGGGGRGPDRRRADDHVKFLR